MLVCCGSLRGLDPAVAAAEGEGPSGGGGGKGGGDVEPGGQRNRVWYMCMRDWYYIGAEGLDKLEWFTVSVI